MERASCKTVEEERRMALRRGAGGKANFGRRREERGGRPFTLRVKRKPC